jgi:hypothetical protein
VGEAHHHVGRAAPRQQPCAKPNRTKRYRYKVPNRKLPNNKVPFLITNFLSS